MLFLPKIGAETNPTLLGAANNPEVNKNGRTFRHTEIHRQRCDKQDCTYKSCPKVCGTIVDRKAVANPTTSRNLPTNPDVKLVEDVSTTQMDGAQGSQHLAVYKHAHDTRVTYEYPKGSQKLQNETKMTDTLLNHADTE